MPNRTQSLEDATCGGSSIPSSVPSANAERRTTQSVDAGTDGGREQAVFNREDAEVAACPPARNRYPGHARSCLCSLCLYGIGVP